MRALDSPRLRLMGAGGALQPVMVRLSALTAYQLSSRLPLVRLPVPQEPQASAHHTGGEALRCERAAPGMLA